MIFFYCRLYGLPRVLIDIGFGIGITHLHIYISPCRLPCFLRVSVMAMFWVLSTYWCL